MTIPHAYRVTLHVAPEHTEGPLTPQSVRDFVSTLGGNMGQSWDHPPEFEIAEVAAPGTWSVIDAAADAAGGPLFAFHEDRARAALAKHAEEEDDYYGPEPVTLQSDADELHDCVDKAMWPEQHTEMGDSADPASAIITSLRPHASISIYPQSLAEPDALLAVHPGGEAPVVLLGSTAPTPDEQLSPVDYTIAFLRDCVREANALVSTYEAGDREGPVLNHSYAGAGLRLTCSDGSDPLHAGGWEQILGSFRVICWLPDGGAIVGNGESPEQFWRTTEAPERIA